MVAARPWKSVWEPLPSPSLAGWSQMSLYQGKQAGIYAEAVGQRSSPSRKQTVFNDHVCWPVHGAPKRVLFSSIHLDLIGANESAMRCIGGCTIMHTAPLPQSRTTSVT